MLNYVEISLLQHFQTPRPDLHELLLRRKRVQTAGTLQIEPFHPGRPEKSTAGTYNRNEECECNCGAICGVPVQRPEANTHPDAKVGGWLASQGGLGLPRDNGDKMLDNRQN